MFINSYYKPFQNVYRGGINKVEKNKLATIILIFALMSMINGCEKSESVYNPKDITTSSSPTSAITAAPTITPTIEPSATPTIAPTTVPTVTPIIKSILTPEELSMEAYEKFMKSEAKISFDRFMPEDYFEGALYKTGSEYTLSEVLEIITEHYFNFTNTKIACIDYSYIDCGKDGVNELVLCFGGMDLYAPDDGSTLVYIIKYIDGKLYLCFYYETWARCDASINEYGYYQSGGSGGANKYSSEYGLIDKDGNWQPIVSIESEQDINQLTLSDELGKIHEVAEKKGIAGQIELDTIRYNENVDNSDEVGNEEYFYTFYVYDDSWDLIEDVNLYTNSIYKDIFDEAKVPFITPDEVSTIISKKEEKVGATTEIKEGAEITWKTLSGNMFSDYVGR